MMSLSLFLYYTPNIIIYNLYELERLRTSHSITSVFDPKGPRSPKSWRFIIRVPSCMRLTLTNTVSGWGIWLVTRVSLSSNTKHLSLSTRVTTLVLKSQDPLSGHGGWITKDLQTEIFLLLSFSSYIDLTPLLHKRNFISTELVQIYEHVSSVISPSSISVFSLSYKD